MFFNLFSGSTKLNGEPLLWDAAVSLQNSIIMNHGYRAEILPA